MKVIDELQLKENEIMFEGKIEIYSRKSKSWLKTNSLILTWDGNTPRVLERTEDGKFKEFNTYINEFSSGKKTVKYWSFHYGFKDGYRTVIKFHNAFAQVANLPFYKRGKVADHIDRNTLNNNLDNIQWVSKAENSRSGWYRMTKEEREARAANYGKLVKEAHARGSYKDHYEVMHEAVREKFRKLKSTKEE